jgi:hypothetical protein
VNCSIIKTGDVTAVVCRSGQQRKVCESCGKPATIQCDYPVKRRASNVPIRYEGNKPVYKMVTATCDRYQCENCATEVAPNVHYCKPHAAMGAPKL